MFGWKTWPSMNVYNIPVIITVLILPLWCYVSSVNLQLYAYCTSSNSSISAIFYWLIAVAILDTIQYSGFVSKVLICANYASCRELINFNSAVTLALSFQLITHVTVLCLWFLFPTYVSVQILQKSGHFCFAASPKRPKDWRGGCVHHDNIAELLQCNSPKYPCRRGILWSQI